MPVPADTPPVLLDPLRLRQVMSNLISNAIKFTHKGYVHTSLRLTPTAQASTWLLHFTVQDSGVGFQASKADSLFQPFTQGLHHNPAMSGTGLGLAITRSLVQLMG
jgi:two-component system sensor histidine kinase EvgS